MTPRNGRPVAAGIMSGNGTAGRPSRWLAVLRRGLPRSPRPVAVAARLVAVVGLGIDAYVHLDLASTYAEAEAPVNEGSCSGPRPCWPFSRRWR